MIGMLFKLSLSRFFFQSQNFLVILGSNLLESPQNGTGTGRNQTADNNVLFQSDQLVDLAGNRRFGQNAGRFLEDAAEINDLVCSEALVIPSRIGSA